MGYIDGEKYKIEQICKMVKSGEVFHNQLELTNTEETKLRPVMKEIGTRKIYASGYDVLSNRFYVIDSFRYMGKYGLREYTNKYKFKSLASYLKFVENDIYENSNFFQMDLSEHNFPENIDMNKIKEMHDRVGTISNSTFEPTLDEMKVYNIGVKNKKSINQWISKLEECSTSDEIYKVFKNLQKSKSRNIAPLSLYIINYLNNDKSNLKRLDLIMEFLSYYFRHDMRLLKQLIFMYGSEAILERYDYNQNAKSTNSKKKSELRKFARQYNESTLVFSKRYLFDEDINLFVEIIVVKTVDSNEELGAQLQFIDTFNQLMSITNNSLMNTDITREYKLDIDLNQYHFDNTTLLPPHLVDNVECIEKKYYEDGYFYVEQQWYDQRGSLIKSKKHKFAFWGQFCHFLENDICGADLSKMKNLDNLKTVEGLKLKNCKVKSEFAELLGIPVKKVDFSKIDSFDNLVKNENKSLVKVRHRNAINTLDDTIKQNVINYVSDIHLLHKFKVNNCQSEIDAIQVIRDVVTDIKNSIKFDNQLFPEKPTIIINGDTSSEIMYFEIFVRELGIKLANRANIFFTLGNHELWNFSNIELSK